MKTLVLTHGTTPLGKVDYDQAHRVLGGLWETFVERELGGRSPRQLPTQWD